MTTSKKSLLNLFKANTGKTQLRVPPIDERRIVLQGWQNSKVEKYRSGDDDSHNQTIPNQQRKTRIPRADHTDDRR